MASVHNIMDRPLIQTLSLPHRNIPIPMGPAVSTGPSPTTFLAVTETVYWDTVGSVGVNSSVHVPPVHCPLDTGGWGTPL